MIKNRDVKITSEYIEGKNKLSFDDEISSIIDKCIIPADGTQLFIVFRNDNNEIYRKITVYGMNVFLKILIGFNKLNLKDLRYNEINFDRIDAEFVPGINKK
jgi:hypothetical protein